MTKEIICVICPRGCRIKIEEHANQIIKIENHGCKKGIDYANNEFKNPRRILTSSIPIEGAKDGRMLPIRSSAPIPKNLITLCMEQIKKTGVKASVQMHQIIIENILGTGSDMIACRNMRKD